MVVGLGGMFGAVSHYWDEHISHEGAWWILALDGVLLIPLIFAGFFYPVPALMAAGGLVLLTLVAVGLGRAVYARRHPHSEG